jgi:hypothetical protein
MMRTDGGPYVKATGVTVATATLAQCRGIYIGATQSLDFCLDGTNWVTFASCTAGQVFQIAAVGARKTAGPAAPDANQVIFLY